MNEEQGQSIVTALREAATLGQGAEELADPEARAFSFMEPTRRPRLLGSFRVTAGGDPFYVVVIVKERKPNDFQFFVMEGPGRAATLGTDTVEGGALVWRYTAAKRTGDNQARKAEFRRLTGSESLRISLPTDFAGFVKDVRSALDLRHRADSAGGEGSEDEPSTSVLEDLERWLPNADVRRAVTRALVESIRLAHEKNPGAWCITRPKGQDVIRLNVGVVRVFDIYADHVELGVVLDPLPEAALKQLPGKLDQSRRNLLLAKEFGNNGALVLDTKEFLDLSANALRAHVEIIDRAARSKNPFRRFHNPEILEALRDITDLDVPDPATTGEDDVAYWKIAPGEGGSDWDNCRANGYIGIRWGELGDLSEIDEAEFEKRAADGRAKYADWSPGVRQAWTFRNIGIGDRIVANAGIGRVLGVGTVSGPYEFVAGEPFAHRLPVTWNDVTERRVDMRGWRATIVRLTQDMFERAASAPPAGAPAPEKVVEIAGPLGGLDFGTILASLQNQSLAFPSELVASYLLALQAKRFVLLTGISGTGKTQLALAIAQAFKWHHEQRTAPVAKDGDVDGTVGHATLKYRRILLPREALRLFPELEDVGHRSIKVDNGTKVIEARLYRDASRPMIAYVALDAETLWPWFNRTFALGDTIRFSKGKDDDVLIVRKPAATVTQAEARHAELVAVRPDWTDSRALLGFYNPLVRRYQSTPVLDLLLRAAQEAEAAKREKRTARPFFLIFDEMNLARVEHYFSDFLSAMESQQPIALHDDPDLVDAEEGAVPERIVLPPNLFVVGTVNVDETTHMFSPKVLDRAFVLEFNEVSLAALDGTERENADPGLLSLKTMSGGLALLDKPTAEEWERFSTLAGGTLRSTLEQILVALERENRHFGYRVAREIARFVDLASQQAKPDDEVVWAAFDVAVLAKVLPKLHGSQAELERVLASLFAIAAGVSEDSAAAQKLDGWRIEAGQLRGEAKSRLPRVGAKLLRMRRRLRTHGFTSFIE